MSCGYGQASVIHDLSLHVETGEVVALLGRNGAGKTTFLHGLAGLLPSTGTVRLAGIDITNWPGHRIYSRGMALVPQEHIVFPGLTVAEHLKLAQHKTAGEQGLEPVFDLFPVLHQRLDQAADTLSGGERKMLGIGQALAVEPSLILMDEPTEGVAPVVVEQLISAIEQLSQTSAVLLVEQNLDTALAVGSRGYVLEHRTVAVSGDLAELHASGQLQKKLAV